ncbi:CsbD family protein [Lichenicoccus sp.]|uniref:CsbD family protein n=1 Tax=Lichenicoccus sp. TaxID=2781899 RepID=UPI003D101415
MDKDRTEGIGHQVKGALKEGAGKLTGNERLEAEGKVERTGGKVQEGVGKGKDTLRDAADSLKR